MKLPAVTQTLEVSYLIYPDAEIRCGPGPNFLSALRALV